MRARLWRRRSTALLLDVSTYRGCAAGLRPSAVKLGSQPPLAAAPGSIVIVAATLAPAATLAADPSYSLICIAFCNCTLVLRELGDPGEFARARRGANKSPTSPRFSPAPNVSCFILLQMRSISRRSLPHKFQIMSSRTFEIILQGRRSPRSRRRPLRVDRRRARS